MRRKIKITFVLPVVLLALSCSKYNGTDDDSFYADIEPDKPVTTVKVAVTSSDDLSGIDAGIIMTPDGIISSLQSVEQYEIQFTATTAKVVRHADIYYLSASLTEDDEMILSETVADRGGRWVLYVSGVSLSPAFINCIEGFCGQGNAVDGSMLYMHTELYSRITAFSMDESQTIVFTING